MVREPERRREITKKKIENEIKRKKNGNGGSKEGRKESRSG